MGLLINQGKQDTSKDLAGFEPITEDNVTVVIEKLELNKNLPGNFDVFLRLMTGQHKGWLIKDTVSYEASSEYSWKYRSLRNCAGVPYKEDEPAQIDIEALLKDRVLKANFVAKANSKNEMRQYVNYKKADATAIQQACTGNEESEEIEVAGVTLDNGVTVPEDTPNTTANPEPQQNITISSDDDEWN